MAKIWGQKIKKYVKTRNIKTIIFPFLPGFEFFLHKTLGCEGYTVSEKTSGAAVWHGWDKENAIEVSERLLKKKGKRRLKTAIAAAIAIQKEE